MIPAVIYDRHRVFTRHSAHGLFQTEPPVAFIDVHFFMRALLIKRRDDLHAEALLFDLAIHHGRYRDFAGSLRDALDLQSIALKADLRDGLIIASCRELRPFLWIRADEDIRLRSALQILHVAQTTDRDVTDDLRLTCGTHLRWQCSTAQRQHACHGCLNQHPQSLSHCFSLPFSRHETALYTLL